MPPKTRGPRKALRDRQEVEEGVKAPATASKNVPKAKRAAKDPDKASTDVPDKARTTAKVTFDLKATSQKPTKGKKGGGRRKQNKEEEEQAMALTGRKRRQGAAVSSAGKFGTALFGSLTTVWHVGSCVCAPTIRGV